MTKPIITVFGGSTPRPGDADYLVAEAVGRGLARYGFGIATGGYMGTMEAVSRGAAESGGLVIGVTCNQIETWRQAGPNQWVQREIRVETVRERILRLIDISTGLIALPGGIGTLAEVALSWSFLQTGAIEPRPLVLVGELWRKTIAAFLDSEEKYVPKRDEDLLTFVPDEAAAIRYFAEWRDEAESKVRE